MSSSDRSKHDGTEKDSTEHGDSEPQARSTHRRVLLVGAVLPIAIAVVATILMVSWLPDLPDPIAVHWSGAGPDGFGPAVPFVFMTLIIVVVYSAFAVAMTWRTSPSGNMVTGQKFLLTIGVWMSTTLSIGLAGSIYVQRGLTDAKDAPDVGIILAIGAAVGLLVAAGTWFLFPREEEVPRNGKAPKSVDLRGEERLSWSRSTRMGNGMMITLAIVIVGVLSLVVFTSLPLRPVTIIWFVFVDIVAALLVTVTWWRVSADHRGFTARGALGWPVKRIPLADIRTVQVVDVQPVRDFGGYGWRWIGGGQSGVVLRTGPGIEITSSKGKRFVVTVDDAETGAGVIAALLKRVAQREA